MSGPSNAQTDVVWPGYVAAMASLLLSLLLVAAVLVVTISQIGSVSESYEKAITETGFKSMEEVGRIAKLAGLAEADPALLSSGGQIETGVVGKTNARSSSAMSSANLGGANPDRPALDFSRANFDPEAARAAAKLAAADAELLAQIDLSKVDVTRISFDGIDLSKIDLSQNISASQLKKIDFSRVNFGVMAKGRIEVLKPFIAKEGIRYQLQKLQWQQQMAQRAKQQASQLAVAPRSQSLAAPAVVLAPAAPAPPAPPPPPPKPEPAPAPKNDRLQVTLVEEAANLSPAQKQQLVQALAELERQGGIFRIWTNLPTDDIYLKRTAYAQVMALRALAVEAGFTGARLQVGIDTVPGMPMPQSDMTIYIARPTK